MKVFMKIFLTLLLGLYLLVLTKLILLKYIGFADITSGFDFSFNEYQWRASNFIPLKTIIYYLFLADVNLNIKIENLVGNVIGFVPLGFILPLLSKRFLSLKAVIAAAFSLSLTYEIVQLLFGLGSFDVDDLILNTLGGILGYMPIKLTYRMIHYRKRQLNMNMSSKR
jgi:glycopeptide antibiotics resistance protein